MSPPDILLVFTTLPEAARAHALAEALVDKRLAACVNILAPCASVYRWQGAVERAQETPLVIKTTLARYPALEAFVREAHPYELPELIAVPVTRGLAGYLDWVAASTIPLPTPPRQKRPD
ncbi:MAG: divalent-cation tolerance protein CutA [Azoarcus sp.]|jgi:periplasmic divalent cation tolerance protein|nr:divalent-cation tolerance protein CutA [Azoarcus sp.]